MRALAVGVVVALAVLATLRGEYLAALCAAGWALALYDRLREVER